ncbi:hypothetical protein ACLOJK_002176 [Asimina triloba]
MVFGATRVLEIVKRNDSPGLLWKKIKLTTTRKANAKKRLLRVWQEFQCRDFCLICCPTLAFGPVALGISGHRPLLDARCLHDSAAIPVPIFTVPMSFNEAVLKACSEPPPSRTSNGAAGNGDKGSIGTQAQEE